MAPSLSFICENSCLNLITENNQKGFSFGLVIGQVSYFETNNSHIIVYLFMFIELYDSLKISVQ